MERNMKFSTYEAVGIAGSIGFMALALWLVNLQASNQALFGKLSSETATVIVSSEGDQEAALADALTEAGVDANGVQRLVIDDVVIGTGEPVVSGDTVTVHYVGSLPNGTQFDSSYARGEAFTFTVGDGRVIPGWEAGITGMRVGGQRVLVIPPALGYGEAQTATIPANSTLVFAIELLSIE